jgi:hypothetical protein
MEIAKTLQQSSSATKPDSRAEIDAAVKYAEVSEILLLLILLSTIFKTIYSIVFFSSFFYIFLFFC